MFHIIWKVKQLSSAEPVSDSEAQRREKLQEQRDQLMEALDSCAFGDNSRAVEGVRRAVSCINRVLPTPV